MNLTATGLPAGVTASFSPNPISVGSNATAYRTMTQTVSSTAALGQHTFTITGTSGAETSRIPYTVGVYVPTFTFAPAFATVGQGSSAAVFLDIDGEFGFSGSVNLSVTGLPNGVTASFSPNPPPEAAR